MAMAMSDADAGSKDMEAMAAGSSFDFSCLEENGDDECEDLNEVRRRKCLFSLHPPPPLYLPLHQNIRGVECRVGVWAKPERDGGRLGDDFPIAQVRVVTETLQGTLAFQMPH